MKNKASKILLISSNYFYPPSDGTTLRDYNLFKNFSNHFRFDLLTFGNKCLVSDQKHLAGQLGPYFKNIFLVPSSTLKKIQIIKGFRRIKNIFYPYKLSMGESYYSDRMATTVKEKVFSLKYDLIYCCDFSIRYLDYSFERPPVIVDLQDSPSLLLKSYIKTEKYLKRKVLSYLNYIWAKRYERVHFSKIKNMIFVSPMDQAFVQRNCPNSNLWVVPNGVNTEYFKPKQKGTRSKNSLLFTGVMDYRPNHESMIYFMKEILPLLKKATPNITLTIAGKNPTHDLIELAQKNPEIKLTGFVKDLRPYFNECMIYVAPIISGAGMKNKILEAWAMSKPVVASSMSCIGLKAVDGQNCLIADSPHAFAEKIILLFSDLNLRNKLAQNARSTAKELYSWQSRARMLEDIFSEVIENQNKSKLT